MARGEYCFWPKCQARRPVRGPDTGAGWLDLSEHRRHRESRGCWDGSKATILGSGGIFRFRSDGSQVQEFARGLTTPTGPSTRDGVGNFFQSDRLAAGSRILHVLEGADYGWRSDIDPPDLDRPGTPPAMLQSEARGPIRCWPLAARPFRCSSRGYCSWPMPRPATFWHLRSCPQAIRSRCASGSSSWRRSGEVLRPGSSRKVLKGRFTLSMPALRSLAFCGSRGPARRDLQRSILQTYQPSSRLSRSRTPTIWPLPRKSPDLQPSGRLPWDGRAKTGQVALYVRLALLVDDDADLARLAADALGDHLPDDAETQGDVFWTAQQNILAGPLPVRRSLCIARQTRHQARGSSRVGFRGRRR